MSWLIAAFLQVWSALQAWLTRLIHAVAGIARPTKPCATPVVIQMSAAVVKDEGTFSGIRSNFSARRASGPTSPSQQSVRSAGVKRGSHAARALFHDPFKVPTPLVVYEITSNAFSPTTSDGSSFFTTDPASPPSDTHGSEFPFSPSLECETPNSPSIASTAPTTPPSVHSPSTSKSTFSRTLARSSNADDEEVPFSALMIQGVDAKATKRYGVSGPLVASQHNQIAWIASSISPSNKPAAPVHDASPVASYRAEERIIPIPPDDRHPQNCDYDLKPSAERLSAWWTMPLLEVDEVSVYSLESHTSPNTASVHGNPRPSSAPRAAIPEIIFTPPSQPTTPEMSCNPTVEDVSKLGRYLSSDLTLVEPSIELDGITEGNLGKPTHLLVPSLDSKLELKSMEIAAIDSNDVAMLKKRRRNACRLTTSSIDIILAGLDQDFTNAQSVSDGFDASPSTPPKHTSNGNPKSSPRQSLLLSPGYTDYSGSTLMVDESMESRFSDSSDDEDEDIFTHKSSTSKQDDSWASPRLSTYEAGSILTTILEEEEASGSESDHFSSQHERSPTSSINPLKPSAIIGDDVLRIDSSRTTTRRKWFSMIEFQTNASTGERLEKRKYFSAPALLGSGIPKLPCSLSVPSGIVHLSFLVTKGIWNGDVCAEDMVSIPRGLIEGGSVPSSSTPRSQVMQSPNHSSQSSTPSRIQPLTPLLPWSMYSSPETPPTKPFPASPSQRSSVSSTYSDPSCGIASATNTPEGIADSEVYRLPDTERISASMDVSDLPSIPDEDCLSECDVVLHAVLSNPQGLSGILAILERMDFEGVAEGSNGTQPGRPLSLASSLSSVTIAWNARWSADERETLGDSEIFTGAIAM